MLDDAAVEKRLTALEQEVASLKVRISANGASENWLEKVAGLISDPEVLREVTAYGRAINQADRPGDEPAEQS